MVEERDEQDKGLPLPWYRYYTDEGEEVSLLSLRDILFIYDF